MLMRVWRAQDSLQPTARLLHSVMGSEHYVVKVLEDLAEANLSAATRSAREQRRRLQEAELASRCVVISMPEGLIPTTISSIQMR